MCGRTVVRLLMLFFSIVLAGPGFAMNGRTTYQAKIAKPNGYPLESSSVNFRFTVLDTVGSCILYIEDYAAINMSDTGGLVSFSLGNGTRSFPTSGTSQTFQNIFDNSVTSFPCQNAGVYLPGPSDVRKIVMQFNEGSGWQTLPAMTINSVPYAMYANETNNSKTLNNKTDTAFVEYSTLAALNCQSYEALRFNGASFSCVNVSVSATQVVNALGYAPVASVSATAPLLSTGGTTPMLSITQATSSTNGYLSSVDWNAFNDKQAATATAIIATLGYTPANSANSIDLGSASATGIIADARLANQSGVISGTQYTKVTVDSKGRVTLGANLAASDIIFALGFTPADNSVSGTYAQRANNLSDLSNITTARTNLGLGTLAVANGIDLGSASATGTIADARLANQTGVTSGTQYTKVTVDGKGRVVIGTNLSSSDVTTALGFTPANSTSSTQWTTSGATISYSTGNVGIGTTDPNAKLHVNGNIIADQITDNSPGNAFYINSASVAAGVGSVYIQDSEAKPIFEAAPIGTRTNYSWLRLDGGTDTQMPHIGSFANSTNPGLALGPTTSTSLVINASGNIGIGTNTPSAKLDVQGQVKMSMGSALVNPAGNAVDFVTGNTQYVTFSSCPGNALTVNLYSMFEGSSYSIVVIAPSGCLVDFTGISHAYGGSGGTAVTAFKYPAGQKFSSTGNPMVYSFLRANNFVFVAQVVDFQ